MVMETGGVFRGYVFPLPVQYNVMKEMVAIGWSEESFTLELNSHN